MLAELLLVLSGHPSSFFVPPPASSSTPSTLVVSPALAEHLHPGELASLNILAELAFRYTYIKQWASEIQQTAREAVLYEASRKGKEREREREKENSISNQYLSTLAGGILDVLKEYDLLVVQTEAKILQGNGTLVQDHQGYVPLSSLVAVFSKWQIPVTSLYNLVLLLGEEELTPGHLLEMVQDRTDTGDPFLEELYLAIRASLNHLFLIHLTSFLLYGLTLPSSPSVGCDIGPDEASPQHRIYALNTDLLLKTISESTRESILYVGRVTATLRREKRVLPKGLTESLRVEIMDVKGLDEGGGLDWAVQRARAEVGEWLWKHVLTGHQIAENLEAFGDYFLTRNADYSVSVIREISRLRLDKLITAKPHSSSSVIREQDLNLALLRASVGTSAETDRSLDKLRLKMDNGPLRPLLPTLNTPRNRGKATYSVDGNVKDMFSSSLLGTPLTLTTTTSWPLDLFMTPPSIQTYSDIYSYLIAIRETHQKVLECWTSLSAAQRQRRKWTGVNEGGTDEEVGARKKLARKAWGIIRIVLFFLDQLTSHFMTDIIDVQHKRLIEQLEQVSAQSQHDHLTGSVNSTLPSPGIALRPSSPSFSKRSRAHHGAASTRGDEGDTQSLRSRAPPTPSKSPTTYLDFLTLRQMHTRHLSFLREGLLLTDRNCLVIVKSILETSKRFVGLVERWGGDVLPELLLEGTSGEEMGEMVRERIEVVSEIQETLDELFADFFKALLESQNPSKTVDASLTGLSLSRIGALSRSRQASFVHRRPMVDKSKIEREKEERGLEAEAVMGRHIEQLLLRLDFNGVFTAWKLKEDEEVDTQTVLAEGGL